MGEPPSYLDLAIFWAQKKLSLLAGRGRKRITQFCAELRKGGGVVWPTGGKLRRWLRNLFSILFPQRKKGKRGGDTQTTHRL